MDKVTGRLIVFFDDPFWAGVFERTVDGKLFVCKVIFGAEPTDAEVYELALTKYDRLNFSQGVDHVAKEIAKNPKRRQREAAKAMKTSGVGTKSQQALQMQREEMKTERKHDSIERRLAEQERKFELRQQKRKEKHKGH